MTKTAETGVGFKVTYPNKAVETTIMGEEMTLEQYVNAKFGTGDDYKENGVKVELMSKKQVDDYIAGVHEDEAQAESEYIASTLTNQPPAEVLEDMSASMERVAQTDDEHKQAAALRDQAHKAAEEQAKKEAHTKKK